MEELVRRFQSHRISRRDFVRQLGALGFTAAAAQSLLAQIETNAPMGEGKGIHPGRVVWVRDPAATGWDGKTGHWWDDANTDQAVVDRMTSSTLQALTGEKADLQSNGDNYLHEAAQAVKPPSGTVYDPNGTGKPLASLGVHEHWNNAKDKRYSRNLGRKEGIELIAELT